MTISMEKSDHFKKHKIFNCCTIFKVIGTKIISLFALLTGVGLNMS